MSLPAVLSTSHTLPVMAAPMYIASGPELVAAQCQAGLIGSFPALNARPPSSLASWIDRISKSNAAYAASNPGVPIGALAVNLIVHRTNTRLDQDLTVIAERKVPIVITSLGAQQAVNETVHSYGGIVLHDVTSNEHARKAIDKGADGLIAVAAGAGGHGGRQSPFALVREIRQWYAGPVLLGGAIAHGASVLAAQAVGADLAYVGSAFLATAEANTVPDYKRMVLQSSAKDIVYTDTFTGIHGNYLRSSIEAAGLDPDNLPLPDLPANTVRFGAPKAKAWRDIWGCGQGVGAIAQPLTVRELVAELRQQYHDARRAISSRMCKP